MNTQANTQAHLKLPIWGTSRHDLLAVDLIDAPLEWQKKGLSKTSTGYGKKIPTRSKVRYQGRLYRVYCDIYSNSGHCYICGNFGSQNYLTVY